MRSRFRANKDNLNNMDKTKINILGSCVLLDAVEFSSQAREKIEVANFLQNNSAITLGSAKLSEVCPYARGSEDFKATHPCWHRWFMANAEEEVYDRLRKSDAEYLLTSLDECAYGYYSFKKGDLEARICPSAAITANDILKKLGYIEKLASYQNESERMFELAQKHARHMRTIYSPEKTSLVKFVPAQHYIENGKIGQFTSDENQATLRNFFERLHEIFLTEMPEAQTITLPDNLLGDARHKWGK